MSKHTDFVDYGDQEPSAKNLVGFEGGVWQITGRRAGEDEDLRCGWMGSMDDRSRRAYYRIKHIFGPNPTGCTTIKEADPNDFAPLTEMEIIAYAAL